MRDKIWAVLGYAFLLALLSAPFLFVYYFLTDPVNAIVLAVSAWLWMIVIIVPIFLLSIVALGFFTLISGVLYAIFDLIKSLFK